VSYDFMSVGLYRLCVRVLKGKRLQLSTPSLIEAAVRHVLTPGSKGQTSMSRGYQMRSLRGSASRLDCLDFLAG